MNYIRAIVCFIVGIVLFFDILPIQNEKAIYATLFLLIASISIEMEEK